MMNSSDTFFNSTTPEGVRFALEGARRSGDRIRIWYGDSETGKAWPDEFSIIGYVSRSVGPQKVPILLHDARSIGGMPILADRIVRIDTTSGVRLYTRTDFDPGEWIVEQCDVYRDGELFARCKNERQAQRLAEFMVGKRYAK